MNELVLRTESDAQGFVKSNPRPGAIYLCLNNAAVRSHCVLCGDPYYRPPIPLAFFYEGDPGAVVCHECAERKGYLIAPVLFDEFERLVLLGEDLERHGWLVGGHLRVPSLRFRFLGMLRFLRWRLQWKAHELRLRWWHRREDGDPSF